MNEEFCQLFLLLICGKYLEEQETIIDRIKTKAMVCPKCKYTTLTKEQVKEIKDEILSKLGSKYTAKVIGFTIVLKKWRKARGK